MSATGQRSADDHHWHAWEEMPPLRPAEGEGGPDSLDRRQVTLTLCPVRRHQRKDETFFFSLLGLDIDAYLRQPAASEAPEIGAWLMGRT